MVGSRSLFSAVMVVAAVCCLGGPRSVEPATTMVYTPAFGCVGMTHKIFSPSQANPTVYVKIYKVLTAVQTCSTVMMNSAFCNPGVPAPTGTLAAQAFGAQITMMPSCAWNCTGACGATVSTTGPGDGLPVELMEFSIEDETASAVEVEGGGDKGTDGEARDEAVEAPRAAAPH